MPRPKSIRKDLTAGWRRLYQLWELSCKEKKRYALSLLEKVFNKHQNPVVCWSGGKDSTVALHLSRILWQDIWDYLPPISPRHREDVRILLQVKRLKKGEAATGIARNGDGEITGTQYLILRLQVRCCELGIVSP